MGSFHGLEVMLYNPPYGAFSEYANWTPGSRWLH